MFFKVATVLLCVFSGLVSAQDSFPDSKLLESIKKLSSIQRIDTSIMEEGSVVTKIYGDYEVHIYKRTASDIEDINRYLDEYKISSDNSRWQTALKGWRETSYNATENYAFAKAQEIVSGNKLRSLKDTVFVTLAMDPIYKCRVKFIDERLRGFLNAPRNAKFWNVCHNQLFDSAGRQLNVDGSLKSDGGNLMVPPHKYEDSFLLLGGVNFASYEGTNTPDYQGLSVQEKLWVACRYNDLPAVIDSLKKGANPNLFEDKGTALDTAILYSSKEIIRILISFGAKPSPITRELLQHINRKDITNIFE